MQYSFLPILLSLSVGLLMSGCAGNSKASIPSDKPNVILIMTDDQGYGDLACHGNPNVHTPNLDKLYAESVRLTDFHVGTTCSPTRASLMSGQNCNRVGVWHTVSGRSQLDLKYPTMADFFSANGYATAMIGKWHLGDSYPFAPEHRGFEEAFYHGAGGVGQMPDAWDNDYFDDTYLNKGVPKAQKGYCTDVWFDASLDFIDRKRQQEQPFFLYLATNAPHGPFHVDSAHIRPYLNNPDIANPNFYGMITQFDENLGTLLEKLDQWELAENTLLVFLTDNGTSAGVKLDKKGFLKKGFNAGLRGMKGSMYEGGHKVPCFIRWPEKGVTGGKDIATLTAHVDLLPTFIDALALSKGPKIEFDGRSLTSLLLGAEEDESWKKRVLITDTQRQEFPEKWRKSATMQGPWRLINGTDLYNVQKDLGQRENIAENHPELVAELRSAYEAWWADLEEGFSGYTRPILGKSEEPVSLFSHDWHEVKDPDGEKGRTPWHQTHIREGLATNGFWTVEVAETGTYRFDVHRWPKETQQPIQAGLPAKAAVPGGNPLPKGKSLAFQYAQIRIGTQEKIQPVDATDTFISFKMELSAGPTRVQTWMKGEGIESRGAYFVYVQKLEK